MKIVGIILAVIMLSGSAFVSIAAMNKGFDFGDKISKLTEGMSSSDKAAITKEVGSPGRFKAGGALSILAALGCLGLLVVTFVKKPLVIKVAIGTLVLCAVAAIAYPGIETGPMDGMAPRPQMLLALGLAVVGAAGSWLASRNKEASAQRAHAAI